MTTHPHTEQYLRALLFAALPAIETLLCIFVSPGIVVGVKHWLFAGHRIDIEEACLTVQCTDFFCCSQVCLSICIVDRNGSLQLPDIQVSNT